MHMYGSTPWRGGEALGWSTISTWFDWISDHLDLKGVNETGSVTIN